MDAHDLRRTAASKMRAMGASRRIVQAVLNHKDRSVTAVYDRYGAFRVGTHDDLVTALGLAVQVDYPVTRVRISWGRRRRRRR